MKSVRSPRSEIADQSTLAAIIFADGTHHKHVMFKLGGMQRKVQRRAAKKLTAVDQVPKDFPNADDLHGLAETIVNKNEVDGRLLLKQAVATAKKTRSKAGLLEERQDQGQRVKLKPGSRDACDVRPIHRL